MPLSASKLEYWCLFKGSYIAIVQNINNYPALQRNLYRIHKLHHDQELAVYCAEIISSCIDDNKIEFIPIKRALDAHTKEWYYFITRAYAILNWDRNHQFCGHCGQQLKDRSRQHDLVFERECLHCHMQFYPRISPSIIVRIRRGDQILMARGRNFSPGSYALIAGFVEAGESLEDALHREVREEVGITITNVRYFGSQPWPFPDSLMVAYTADYLSGELIVDRKELEHADWYKYDQLPGLPSTKMSIANQLIEDFVNGMG